MQRACDTKRYNTRWFVSDVSGCMYLVEKLTSLENGGRDKKPVRVNSTILVKDAHRKRELELL